MIVMLGFFGVTAQAQIFGVEGGLGLANITSSNQTVSDRFGRAFGAKIGGTIEFDITDDLYLGSGLGFAKKGASTITETFNLYYVNIPIGARYEFFEVGGSGYFFASAGFNVGVLVSANFGGENLSIGNSNGDTFKGLDLGFNTGVGIIFDDTYQVGLHTEFGLIDISTSNNTSLKNIALMVSFGYKFGQ